MLIDHFFIFTVWFTNVFVDHFKILFCNKFSFLLRKHSWNGILAHEQGTKIKFTENYRGNNP